MEVATPSIATKRSASVLSDEKLQIAEQTPAKLTTLRLGSNEIFNPTMLKYYYQNFFPFKLMFQWLSYGNDPNSKLPGIRPDFFYRREFCFTLENEVYVRYLCFRDAEEFAKRTIDKMPERMEIGPVYTAPPDKNKTLSKEAFKPEQRELIFDIDLNDYDDIRTCCVGANICKRCWCFMNVAIKVLDTVLKEDFGFKHIMYVYSGRRGMHCHVADEDARLLTDDQRKAVVDYIDAVNGEATGGIENGTTNSANAQNGHTNINKVLNSLTVPLHPALSRAYTELEVVFENEVIGDNGQALLTTPDHWNKLLDMLPILPDDALMDGVHINLRDQIEENWVRTNNTPQRRWAFLKNTIQTLIMRSGGAVTGPKQSGNNNNNNNNRMNNSNRDIKLSPSLRRNLEKLIPAIVFAYIYPRLDANVSKMRNHLLKAPFCIHPKTGRVCVPIPLTMVDEFNPSEVPTLNQLMMQGMSWTKDHPDDTLNADNDTNDFSTVTTLSSNTSSASTIVRAHNKFNLDNNLWEHTTMKPYIEEFQRFLDGLADSIRRARREAAERNAAFTGDW